MKTKTQMLMWSLSLATGLVLASPLVRAESESGQKPKKERREAGPGERLERMRERLDLSDEQVAQLKEIFAAEREDLRAKRKELGKDADRSDMREAARAIHEGYIPKIGAVLTPEQREKWSKARERMRERREGGPGGGPGGAGDGSGKKRRGPGGPDGDEEGMPLPPDEEL